MKEEIRKKLMENSKENYPRIKEEMKAMLTLEERARESIHTQYNCKGKYPCTRHMDCEMCGGENTPYDCCECGAGDYKDGYIQGATEQKAIDIERMISYVEDMPQDATRQDIIDGLTKAMEGGL